MNAPLPTDERSEAIALANRLLDEPMADPDDDLRMLSRQLLRRHEEVDRLKTRIARLLNYGWITRDIPTVMQRMEITQADITALKDAT